MLSTINWPWSNLIIQHFAGQALVMVIFLSLHRLTELPTSAHIFLIEEAWCQVPFKFYADYSCAFFLQDTSSNLKGPFNSLLNSWKATRLIACQYCYYFGGFRMNYFSINGFDKQAVVTGIGRYVLFTFSQGFIACNPHSQTITK